MVKRVFILVLVLVFGSFLELVEARGGGGHSGGGHSGGFSGGSHGGFSGGHLGRDYDGSHPGYGYGGRVGSPSGRGYTTGRGYIGGGYGFGGPRRPIVRGPAIRGPLPRGAIRGGFWGGIVIGGIFSPFWWPFYAVPVPSRYYAPYGNAPYYEPPYVVVVPQATTDQQSTPIPNCYGPQVDQSGNMLRDKDGNIIPDFTKPVPCPPQQ
jgi:hypothetical protein